MMFECEICKKRFLSKEALNQHKAEKHPPEKKEEKPKKDHTNIVLLAFVGVLAAGVIYAILNLGSSSSTALGAVGSEHTHMDIQTYVDAAPVNFNLPQYQLQSSYVHFEGGQGGVVHKHATGVTIGFMLSTLKMDLSKDCLSMNGVKYCSQGDKTLKVFVNGKQIEQPEKYEMENLDKILVSYGNESQEQLKKQLDSITDKAKTQ